MENKILIGDGWSATLVASLLDSRGEDFTWISGSGAYVWPITPLLSESSITFLKSICENYQIETGEIEEGQFLREFKGKNIGILSTFEKYWTPEQYSLGEIFRFERDLHQIFGQLRENLIEKIGEKRIHSNSIQSLEVCENETEKWTKIGLASGQTLEARQVIYADRWRDLKYIKNLDHKIPLFDFLKTMHFAGVLQVIFNHLKGGEPNVSEVFSLTPYKDSGETIDRHVFGYFAEDGRESVWTHLLLETESEDNHEITKKMRKVKQTLQRAFPDLSVEDSQVKFQEGFIFKAIHKQPKDLCFPYENLSFLSDGYGLNSSIEIVQDWASRYLGLGSVSRNHESLVVQGDEELHSHP